MLSFQFVFSFLLTACGPSGTSAPGLPSPDVHVAEQIYKDKEKGTKSDWEYHIYTNYYSGDLWVMIEFWLPEPLPHPQPYKYDAIIKRKAGSSDSVWVRPCEASTDPNSAETSAIADWNDAHPSYERIEVHQNRLRVSCSIAQVGLSNIDDITDIWLKPD